MAGLPQTWLRPNVRPVFRIARGIHSDLRAIKVWARATLLLSAESRIGSNVNHDISQFTPVLRHGGPDPGVAWRLLAIGRTQGGDLRKAAGQAKGMSYSRAVYLRRLREWARRTQSQSF